MKTVPRFWPHAECRHEPGDASTAQCLEHSGHSAGPCRHDPAFHPAAPTLGMVTLSYTAGASPDDCHSTASELVGVCVPWTDTSLGGRLLEAGARPPLHCPRHLCGAQETLQSRPDLGDNWVPPVR